MLGFDSITGEMRLEALQPGATVKNVQDATGFDLQVSESPTRLEPPTEDELRMLRTLDPEGAQIG